MKWMTVEEFALKEGICRSAAYKRVKENRVNWQRKFGKIVIKVK